MHHKYELGSSVDLDYLLQRDGLPSDHRYGLMPNTLALIAIKVSDARELAAGAAWTPKPEESDTEGAAKMVSLDVV